MYRGGKAPVFEQTLQPLLPPPSPILSSLPLIIMMILLMMMIMIINKKNNLVAGEIDQWLRYHTSLAEDENLVSRSHVGLITNG